MPPDVGHGLLAPASRGLRIAAIAARPILRAGCHSGTGLDLPFTYVQGRGWSVDSLPAFSPGDVQMFSGCRDDQTSADVVAGRGRETVHAGARARCRRMPTAAPLLQAHEPHPLARERGDNLGILIVTQLGLEEHEPRIGHVER